MRPSKRSPGAALIRRLCTLGLPMESIVPALLRALCRETRCDSGVVFWFDESGEIVDLYMRELPSPRVLAEWFARRTGSVTSDPGSPTRAPAGNRIATCDDGTPQAWTERDSGPGPSCRHRDFCGMAVPHDARSQRLCCAVVRNGRAVASLVLNRPFGWPPFRTEEAAVVRSAARYLSMNAGAAPVETGIAMYRVSGEEALLLCDADGRIVKASANAYALLAQASGCPVNRKTAADALERAGRNLIRSLLAQPALPAGCDARGPTRAVVSINAWGLFRQRAFYEAGEPHGVLIQRLDHLLIRLCEAMSRIDVSVQQGEALLLLAQGISQEEMARRMGVAPSTADYHVRELYSKLGAHGRDEAISFVLTAAEAPAEA